MAPAIAALIVNPGKNDPIGAIATPMRSAIAPAIPPARGPKRTPARKSGISPRLRRIPSAPPMGNMIENQRVNTTLIVTNNATRTICRVDIEKPLSLCCCLGQKYTQGLGLWVLCGSGCDAASQPSFRPEATSHPLTLDAQHLLCLISYV